MPAGFDVYFVSIEWESENRIRNFTTSVVPLEPSKFNGNSYFYETVIYNKVVKEYFQIALKTKSVPILNTTGSDSSFFNIPDTDFWILKGEWTVSATNKRYHHCPSINTVGNLYIKINDLRINIDINPNIEGFDFDTLKDDFEGELWNLFTSTGSKATTQVNEVRFGDKIFRFTASHSIISFIHEFSKIVRHPKKELKHAVTEITFEKVKPIPATFKKLALKGVNGLLPTKTYIENYDNYENRFLCFMLFKIHQIVGYNSQFSSQQIKRLNNEIISIENKIKELELPQILVKEQVENEIERYEQFYTNWLNNWKNDKNHLLSNCDNSNCKVNMTFEILYKTGNNGYWGKKDNEFCLIDFPVPMDEIFEEQKGQKVKLKCYCYKSGNAGMHPKYEIKAIETIELVSVSYINILEKQKINFKILEMNNWQLTSILSSYELKKLNEEKINQISTLRKKYTKLESQILSIGEFGKEADYLLPQLTKLLNSDFVKKINFRKLNRFKPSMTYIQNSEYLKSLKFYNEVLNSEGIDISIFGLFEQVTSYGIREMPLIFELWSLISVIGILEKTFSYKHRPEDLHQLLKSITPQIKKADKYVKINFDGDLNGRKVSIHYQKSLLNGKKPDIILEISSGNRNIHIVLDAKFKNYNYKKSVTFELLEIIEKYRENSTSYIFTLHPCKDLSKDEKTMKMTNFGGEKIYKDDGEVEYPLHKFGHLMIKPNEIDNLKKLIGMSLEYLIEKDHSAVKSDKSINPKPEHEMICLSCGNDKVSIETKLRGNNRYHYNCKCDNQDCEHKIYIDYCWNCKTKLYKHGTYWDYHRTSVWSSFDIHCPNCGMTVADRPSNY